MKKKACSILVACLTAAVFFGCAPKKIPVPAVMPAAPPEEILKGMSAQIQPDTVLRTKARFSVNAKKGKFSTGLILLARRPAFLRIESVSIMGLPELILSADERYVRIFSVREDKFYIAPAGHSLYRFFPIDLEPGEAVALVFGLPPDERGRFTLKGSLDGDLYRIDFLAGDEKAESLWLDPALFHLRKVEKFQGGESVYRAELDDYHRVGKNTLPGRIEIHFNLPEKMEVRMRFSESEITNAEKGDFDLEPPEGVKPIYLE